MNEDKLTDLFLLFCIVAVIILKCIGVITVPWIVLFYPILFLMALMVLIIFTAIVVSLINDLKEKRKMKNACRN